MKEIWDLVAILGIALAVVLGVTALFCCFMALIVGKNPPDPWDNENIEKRMGPDHRIQKSFRKTK